LRTGTTIDTSGAALAGVPAVMLIGSGF